MRYIVAAILLLGVARLEAQQIELSTSAQPPDSVRARYIKSYPDHFFVWPLFKQRRLDFRLQDRPDRDKLITYKSNKPFFAGIGLYVFEVVLELTASIPLDEKNVDTYGDTKANDLQLNLFGKQWSIETYRQKYQGFYEVDRDREIPAGMPYPQRPDIVTRNTGLVGSYAFNKRKFSFRSSYNFADTQLKSAGSFMLFGVFSAFSTRGDSAILGPRYDADFGSNSRIKAFRTTIANIAPAYSHTFVKKRFFVNATLAAAPAVNWLSSTDESNRKESKVRVAAFYMARLSIGYSGNRFIAGASYVTQGGNARYDGIELLSSSGTIKVFAGYRFREFGILKKRVADIPRLVGIGD